MSTEKDSTPSEPLDNTPAEPVVEPGVNTPETESGPPPGEEQKPASTDKDIVDEEPAPTGWETTKDWLVVIGITVIFAFLINTFVAKTFAIPSGSMLPTLKVGDKVVVDRITPKLTGYHRGDIVVFRAPVGADRGPAACPQTPELGQACVKANDKASSTYFIKRIVALPGDTFSVEAGVPYVNGKAVQNRSIIPAKDCDLCDFPVEITIPKDHYMMMGDNRGNSNDSRAWGSVPKSSLIGQAQAVYWPLNRWRGL